MKELFNRLSSVCRFLNEKRFVYNEIEHSESEPAASSAGRGGSEEIPVGRLGEKAVANARKYCSEYENVLDTIHCTNQGKRMMSAKQEILKLWDSNREFHGRNKLAKNLYSKIAKAGIREVTQTDIDTFTKKWLSENPNEVEIEGGQEKVRKTLEQNRLADAVDAIAEFMNKKPDFRDEVLIQLYIYLVKYPENRDNASAQKVMDAIKNSMRLNKKLMAFLPNLKTTKSTAIATRPKIGK